ncbi:MAG: hypothetical protein PQJ60_10225 [Spirochaetales bacterium]|nr:hypothetical protein [Spirochaetales bacterium]
MKRVEKKTSYSKESWKPLGIFCLNQKERDDIYSSNSFSRVIDYERQRAKRNESTFALVSCSFGEMEENRGGFRRYLDCVKRTVRYIDHIGWRGEGHVGILLPCTSREGAEQFLSKINTFSGMAKQPVSYRIETYSGEREVSLTAQER